jgi:hypothetical protein
MASTGHHDAVRLRVFENGSETPLDPVELISGCTSGTKETPFIIRYPGNTQSVVLHADVFIVTFLCVHDKA